MSESKQPSSTTKSQFTVLWLLILTAVAGIAFLALARLFNLGDVAPGPAVDEATVLGRGFGEWELLPLAGAAEPVSAESTKGKVVLLNFWATWCPPCRKELPQIAALGKEFADAADFRLVTVSCGQQDFDSAEQAAVAMFEKQKLDVPTYFDPNNTILRLWQERTDNSQIPVTLVLDREGKTSGYWIGAEERYIGEMRGKLEELLGR